MEVNECDIYLQTKYNFNIHFQFVFTVDLNDSQWFQCMCIQVLNVFTVNKVSMCADVVVANGCDDVDGRIWSTLR